MKACAMCGNDLPMKAAKLSNTDIAKWRDHATESIERGTPNINVHPRVLLALIMRGDRLQAELENNKEVPRGAEGNASPPERSPAGASQTATEGGAPETPPAAAGSTRVAVDFVPTTEGSSVLWFEFTPTDDTDLSCYMCYRDEVDVETTLAGNGRKVTLSFHRRCLRALQTSGEDAARALPSNATSNSTPREAGAPAEPPPNGGTEPPRCKRCRAPLAASIREGCVPLCCAFRCHCPPGHIPGCPVVGAEQRGWAS